jgi:hypothetical protein
LQLCFNLKPRNRPTFSQILKHLEIVSNTEVIFKLEDEYLKNQLEWKEEIKERMDFKKEFNNSNAKIYNLDDLVQKRKEELRHATSIRELYEQKLEKANNLYFELNTVLLQLDEREKEIIRREKALNIHNSRVVRPIVKREFKNRAQTYIQRNNENNSSKKIHAKNEDSNHSEFGAKFASTENANVKFVQTEAKNKTVIRKPRSQSSSFNEESHDNESSTKEKVEKEKSSKLKKMTRVKSNPIQNKKLIEKFLRKNISSKKLSLKDTLKNINVKEKQLKLHFVRKNSMKQKSLKYDEKLRQIFKFMVFNMNEVNFV